MTPLIKTEMNSLTIILIINNYCMKMMNKNQCELGLIPTKKASNRYDELIAPQNSAWISHAGFWGGGHEKKSLLGEAQ